MASRAAAKFDIRAVDKSLSTIRNINKNINGMLKPVRNLRMGLKALSRESGLANLGRGVGRVGKEITKLTGIAGAAAGAGFFALNKMTQHADEVLKASINYGISSDAIQEWRFVAERSGVSVATINKSMQAFTKRLAEARNGTGELSGLLSKVNPEFLKQVLAIDNNTDAYNFMLESMSKLPDQQKQILLGDKAFSEAGRELVKITALGGDEISRLRKEASVYGSVLDRDVLQQSAQFQDELTNVGSIVKGVAFAVGAELIPEVKNLVIDLKEWFLINKDVIKPQLAEFAKNAAQGVKEFAGWVKDILPGLKSFIENIGGMKTVAIGLGLVLAGPLLAAIVGLGVALSASPIGLFITAVGVLTALGSKLYDEWKPFRDLIDSINSVISTTLKGFVQLSNFVGNGIMNAFSGNQGSGNAAGGRRNRRLARSAVDVAGTNNTNVGGRIQVQIQSQVPVKVKQIESTNPAVSLDVDAGMSLGAL